MKISILWQFPHFVSSTFFKVLTDASRNGLELVKPAQADLVIYGPFQRHPKMIGRFVKRRARHSPLHFSGRQTQPISVYHTIENTRHDRKFDFSVSFDFSSEDRRHFRFPYWMESIDWSHEGVIREKPLRNSSHVAIDRLMSPLGRGFLERNSKCAAFFGHLREPRDTLLKAVRRHLDVDGYGPGFDDRLRSPERSGIAKDSVLAEYSYCLCPENSLYPGYYTEKILESFAAGCLGLTWTDPNVSADFNPDAFINLLDHARDGYDGWYQRLSRPEELQKFADAPLLTERPSIEPLRDFVNTIVQSTL